ncbi:phosphatidylinositol-specific phospholipase C/glycerophosphodiester phosphodiesterase family protein [Flavisolibacter nicotianae]|uniref:phosphatidylinositol-specific phospholipase C/glycerophosphodiester phosphodiesterase family protein n=1 Tax=Flavisolibacter nicotianae TaxID=2364882 RepID=UPI000EB4CC95|nr:phosphatidylinositol-specific phospholipase C/glycerophosphodiester phosphodiesterase family protein [Flavisolibacter nicotianae]
MPPITTKNPLPAVVFVALVFFANSAFAQTAKPTVANAHSHNDYNQRSAFYGAYKQGFGSIEADIFAVNEQLFVAHDKKNIHADRTLQALYLEPIAKGLKKDSARRLQLLVDIKENGDSVLPLLIRQLLPLQPFYSTGRLLVLISGNRPLPSSYNRYPDFIFFDDDLVHQHTPEQWKRVGLVSLKFSLFTTWKGTGVIPEEDEDRLRRIINSVHASGKGIRFWDAPDTVAAWQELVKLGVDFIGTDSIEKLAHFLER